MSTETSETMSVIPTPDLWEQVRRPGDLDGPYIVIVYDDDWHTFEEVATQMVRAIGCSYPKGREIANEIDGAGRAVVFAGSQKECESVAHVLREIRLQVETDRAS